MTGVVEVPTASAVPEGPAAIESPSTAPSPRLLSAPEHCSDGAGQSSFDCALWTVDASATTDRLGQPSIHNGRVLVGTETGLLAFHASTGRLLWRADLGGRVGLPPGSTDGVVYAVVEESRVVVLDLAFGRILWQTSLEGRIGAGPLLIGGVVVVPMGGRVVGLDSSDGTQRWELPVSGLASQPVAGGTGVVVGDGSGDIILLDPATGEVEWRQHADDWHVAISHEAEVVLASGFSGPLAGLDLASGDELWRTEMDVGWAPAQAPAGGSVYVAAEERIWKIDASTGAALELAALPSGATTPGPTSDGALTVGPHGLLYVRIPGEGIRIHDPDDGTPLWTYSWSRGVGELAVGPAGDDSLLAVTDAARNHLAVVRVSDDAIAR